MAVAVRSSTQAVITTSVSSTTIAKPTGTASGDLLVLVVMVEADAGKAAFSSTGFVQEGSWASPNSASNIHPVIGVFVKTAGGSEPSTYTVNGNGTTYSYAFTLMAVSGADTTTAVSVGPTASTSTATATALVAPTVTPTVTGALLVCAFSQEQSGATTYSTPTSMAIVQEFETTASFTRGGVYSQVLASTSATGTKTSTSSFTGRYTAVSFTINPLSATNWTQTVGPDTAGAADSIVQALAAAQTVGPDTAGAADSIVRAFGAVRSFGDTAGAADSVTAALASTLPIWSVVDAFDTQDTVTWHYFGGSAATGGRLVMTPRSDYGDGIVTNDAYDLTGASVYAEAVTAPNVGNGSTEMYLQLQQDRDNNSNAFSFDITDGGLVAKSIVGGSQTQQGWVTYDPVAHRFLGMYEAGGTVYWTTSPDATTWTDRASMAAPFAVNHLFVDLGTGYWGTEPSPGTAVWDNVNIVGGVDYTQTITDSAGATDSIIVRRSFSALIEDFATKDTSRWYWNGGTDVTGGQVVIPPTVAYGVATLGSQETFDLTASSVSAETVARMGGSGSSETYMTLTDWAGNSLIYSFSDGWLQPKTQIGYTQTNLTGTGFDPAAPRFLRIREAGGTVYWDTSPDGWAWTNVTSIATPIDITALHLELGVGDWGGGTPTTPAIFDNVNVAPPRPSVSTLFDDFTTQDTAKWTFGGTSGVTGGQLVTPCTVDYANLVDTVATYSLAGASVHTNLVGVPGVGDGTTEAFFEITQAADPNNTLGIDVNNGNTAPYYRVTGSGFAWLPGAPTYDPTNHAWLRIRESGGTVYWDVSPDAVSWSNLGSVATPFSVSAMRPRLAAGYWGTNTGLAPAVWDNVNGVGGIAYTQTITDTAGAADSTTVAQGWNATGTDTAGAADSVSQTVGAARAVTDTAGAADSTSQATGSARAVTDTAGATDSVTVAQGWAAVGTDTAGAADSVTQATTHVRTLTDTAGATDSTAAVQGHARTITDTADAVDSSSAVAGTGVTITDSIGTADGLTVVGAGGFSHDDAAGAADSLSQTVDSARAVTDTAGAADSVIASQGWPRTVDDAAGAADSISTAVTGSRPITDTAGTADAIGQAVDHVRVLTDTAGAADSTGQAAGLARTVTDTAGAVDSTAQTSGIGYSQTITDTAGAHDTATQATTAVQTFTDTAGAVDSTTAARLIVVVLSDSAGAHDSMTSQSGGGSTQKSGFLRFLL